MVHNNKSNNYDDYEALFDPRLNDRQGRRKRKAKVKHQPKKSEREIINEIADTIGIEGGFETTYTPALYEEGFLYDSVRGFYEQALITDILARVKGGKEATVYRCAGHPSTGQTYLAAKVYRPRQFRNLRNDHMYRAGRSIIGIDGKELDERDQRARRALIAGSSYGEQLSHTSWLMHEYVTLQRLKNAGADVPTPYGNTENSILMSYHGDDVLAAPTLHDTRLTEEEAEPIFHRILWNIDLMLSQGYIHGDLSAYNILYDHGKIIIIDFPQVTDIATNPNAYQILVRDIKRVSDYFASYGIVRDVDKMIRRIWRKHGPTELEPDEIVSRLLTSDDED